MSLRGVTVAAAVAAGALATTAYAAAPVGPGDTDRSFGSNGRVVLPIARSITPTVGLAARPAGGLLITATTGVTSPRRSGLVALSRIGTSDSAFAGGRVGLGSTEAVSTTRGNDTFTAQPLAQDGLQVRKLTADGQPDPSFGVGGSATVPTNGQRTPRAMAVQPDGKIVITSSTPGSDDIVSPEGPASAIRLLAGGRLDTTFAQDGEYLSVVGGSPNGLGLLPDGRLMIATVAAGGFPSTGEIVTGLFRLTTNGKLDKSFGAPNGYVLLRDTRPYPDNLTHFALDRHGRPLLAGTAGSDLNGFRGKVAVRRYTTSGQADTSFGQGGQFTLTLGRKVQAGASAVALDPQGRIVVAGSQFATSRGLVVRLTARGRLDLSFGRKGAARGRPGAPWSSVLVRGSRITLGGATLGRTTTSYEITRLIGGDDRAEPRISVKRSCGRGRITVRIADASPLKPTRLKLDAGPARTTRKTTIRLRADGGRHRLSIRVRDIAGNSRAALVRLKRCQ